MSIQNLDIIVPPNTVCSIHSKQNVNTESSYYCISIFSLLHSHNTKCHYNVPLLLYFQIHSAPFTQHKMSLLCLAIIVPPGSRLHSQNTKVQYRVSLLLYFQTQSAPFTEHKMSLKCLVIIVPPNTLCSIHRTQISLQYLAIIEPPKTF